MVYYVNKYNTNGGEFDLTGYIASLIVAIITFGMALLQLSLTFGAPLGEYVLGGLNKVLPKKMRFLSGTFSFIFILRFNGKRIFRSCCINVNYDE